MTSQLLAQDLDWTNVGTAYHPLTQITPDSYIAAFIQFALIIIVVVCFAFLLIGGVRWLVSKGEKEATAKAQKTISGALIGLLLALLIFLILGMLSMFFHVNLLQFCIPGVTGECTVTSYIPPDGSGNPPGNPGSGTPVFPNIAGHCPCGGAGAGKCALVNDISNDAGSCYVCTSASWVQHSELSLSSCNTPISCYTCP